MNQLSAEAPSFLETMRPLILLQSLPWKQILGVGVLSVCFMLQGSVLFMQSSSTSIVAKRLLGRAGLSPKLATLPSTMIFVTAALLPPLFALGFGKFGFRKPFLAATAVGIIGGTLATLSIFYSSFPLLCVASTLLGVPNTSGNLFRFAATTLVEPQNSSRAISGVLFFGLIASFLGPFVADLTYKLFPGDLEYMAVYISACGFYVLQGFALLLVPFKPYAPARPVASPRALQDPTEKPERNREHINGEHPGGEEDDTSSDERTPVLGGTPIYRDPEAERSWVRLMTSTGVVVAVSFASVSYLVMVSVMIMVPLVMDETYHLGFDVITDVMTVHGVGMYLPFFFTSFAIELLGEVAVSSVGLVVLVASVTLLLVSAEIWAFYVGMALLGFGWALGFVGSTVLLLKQPTPLERSKLQASNDVMVFGLVAIATISSSTVYYGLGWGGYLYLMLGFLGVGLIVSLFWFVRRCYLWRTSNL